MYKVGNKVRVVGFPLTEKSAHAVSAMNKYCGKIVTITFAKKSRLTGTNVYYIKEDGNTWNWFDDCFVNYTIRLV